MAEKDTKEKRSKNMSNYGKILLDCSKNPNWIKYKEDSIEETKYYGSVFIGAFLLLILLFIFVPLFNYIIRILKIIIFIGWVIFLSIFTYTSLNQYDGLILYAKGITLPYIGLYHKIKKRKYFIPYSEIEMVDLKHKTNPDVILIEIKSRFLPKYAIFRVNREIEETDLKKFKQILIQNKVKVED